MVIAAPASLPVWVQKLVLVQMVQIERPPFSPVRVLIPEQLQLQLLPRQFPPPVELERRQVQALAPLPILQSAWAQEQVLVQGVQVDQSQIAPVRAPGSELHL